MNDYAEVELIAESHAAGTHITRDGDGLITLHQR